MQINVETLGVKELQKSLKFYEKSVIPVTTAKALTFTAERAQNAVNAQIRKKFDRPTRFTKNATYKTSASVNFPEANVYLKDMASGAPHYLEPHIEGGGRRRKRSELHLNYWTVIGNNAKKNQHGNLTRHKYTKILSDIQQYSYSMSVANTKLRSQRYSGRGPKRGAKGKGVKFFRKYSEKAGRWIIYEKVGGKKSKKILPTLIETRAPRYKKRLPFYRIVNEVAKSQFARLWLKQANRELKRLGLR